jgi:hypothetical protein
MGVYLTLFFLGERLVEIDPSYPLNTYNYFGAEARLGTPPRT